MTTATDIQQGTRRIISGTVQNPREDGHGHYLIDLQGTGWTQDRYSVTAFEVAGQETLAALPVGRHIEVVVEAQQKREGKDGSREREWYWRVVGPSNGATPAAATPSLEQRKAAALAPDPRGNSIERQVAAKAATDMMIAAIPRAAEPEFDWQAAWTGWADHIIAWLQGTTAPDTGGASGEAPTEVDDLPFDPSQEP